MPLGGAIVVLNGVPKTQLKISVTMVPTLSQRLHCFVIKVMNRNPFVNILLFMEIVTDVILFLRMKKKDQTGTRFLPHLTPAVTDGLKLACQGVFDYHFFFK